jgi:hypothetical protein
MGWVQHFYGTNGWACSANCAWDGDSFNWSGPGLVVRPPYDATWQVGYRPTKWRFTYGTGSGGNNTLYYGTATTQIPSPAGGGTVEGNIDWGAAGAGDMNRINFYDADIITNIEFYEVAGWTHKFMGVANASISKIAGIAKASIAKVIGS